jgi:N-acetyl-beta-hexosaminidase
MANIRNFGAFTASVRRLVVAVRENAATLPDVSAELAVLEQALGSAEEAKTRQDAHIGNKQVATQDMQAALTRAKDAVIQLQNAAKFKLGPRNEKLSAFQVKPLRKHSPRKSAKLKAQEGELTKQENDLLKKEIELLKKKEEPAAAS